jgi:hypothetical protein
MALRPRDSSGSEADKAGSSRSAERPRASELRDRIPDTSTRRDSDRPRASELRDRIPDTSTRKSETPKSSSEVTRALAAPKAESSKTADTLKSDSKAAGERPKLSEIRKHLLDKSKTDAAGAGGASAKSDLLLAPKGLDTAKIAKPKPADDSAKAKPGDKISGVPDKKSGSGAKLSGSGLEKAKPSGLSPLTKGMLPDKPSIAKLKPPAPPPKPVPFQERLNKNDLGGVAKGGVAQNVKLDQQYQLMRQGDVARRLDLARTANVASVNRVTNVNHFILDHGHHPRHHVYYGWVSPWYSRWCFEFYYCGPSYYAGFCWYPRWCPWVSWAWHYHCYPLWDPRPFWCRPIVYVPAPVWVYYEVPVWEPLPEVPSGTWVDVKKVPVPVDRFDLQMLAVRFVDPGHPDEKLGPRYRVWFRNNSTKAVTQPFNVTLLASADGKLAAGLPQAGVRVTSIGAGETQSVDIRLPFEVTQMVRTPDGKPAPFGALHALVDANREVAEVNRANNGTKISPVDVLPVDPAAFEVDPKSVPAGGELILAGEGFGPEPGKVLVHLGGLEMEAEILGWYDLGVRLNVPRLPLTGPTGADLIVVRGDGAAANPVQVTVTPPAGPGAVPEAPPAPKLEPPKLEPPKPAPPASF